LQAHNQTEPEETTLWSSTTQGKEDPGKVMEAVPKKESFISPFIAVRGEELAQ